MSQDEEKEVERLFREFIGTPEKTNVIPLFPKTTIPTTSQDINQFKMREIINMIRFLINILSEKMPVPSLFFFIQEL